VFLVNDEVYLDRSLFDKTLSVERTALKDGVIEVFTLQNKYGGVYFHIHVGKRVNGVWKNRFLSVGKNDVEILSCLLRRANLFSSTLSV
jgi:hypothetical protein